jgi:hypothetical protein
MEDAVMSEAPDFQKGHYIEVRDTGETGRIVGAGSKPGYWRVKLDGDGEREIAEASLVPVY